MSTQQLRCEICGGELQYSADGRSAVCLACGNKYWFKEEKGEALMIALNRAAEKRRRNDFDGAIDEYTVVLKSEPNDADALWGLVLSTYGIEYVEDYRTKKLIPTCRRVLPRKSILENEYYLRALENATPEQSEKYQKQAKVIDKLQRDIERKMDDEEDYDVFISFKSTDDDGNPTADKAIARRIYDELERRGIKTFFSEVTLESRVGEDYEPIIYKALFSCRFFVLVATKEEYIEAPWVKNEWSRFRDRMRDEGMTNCCCPVFKGIKPSMLPSFLRNQGVDLAKYPGGGYEIELADSISLRLGKTKRQTEAEEIKRQMEEQRRAIEESQRALEQKLAAAARSGGAVNKVANLIVRAKQEMEARDYKEAAQFFDQALNLDPENAEAWLGKFYANNQLPYGEPLTNSDDKMRLIERRMRCDSKEYKNAMRYASPELKHELIAQANAILTKINTIVYREYIDKLVVVIGQCKASANAADRRKVLDDAMALHREMDIFASEKVEDVSDESLIPRFRSLYAEFENTLAAQDKDFKCTTAHNVWWRVFYEMCKRAKCALKEPSDVCNTYDDTDPDTRIAMLDVLTKEGDRLSGAIADLSEADVKEVTEVVEQIKTSVSGEIEEYNGIISEDEQQLESNDRRKKELNQKIEKNPEKEKKKYKFLPYPDHFGRVTCPSIMNWGIFVTMAVILGIGGAIAIHFVFDYIPYIREWYLVKKMGFGVDVEVTGWFDILIARGLLTLLGGVLGVASAVVIAVVLKLAGSIVGSLVATIALTAVWLVLCALISILNAFTLPVNIVIASGNAKRAKMNRTRETVKSQLAVLSAQTASVKAKRDGNKRRLAKLKASAEMLANMQRQAQETLGASQAAAAKE